MKKDNRKGADRFGDITSMNARRKEKKEQLWNNRKPTTKSEWVALGELLISWSQTSDSVTIDDFGILYKYGPHRISKWVDDSEDFAEAWEIATYNVGQRRNKLWKNSDKLLEKSLSLYDWRIRDREDELKKADANATPKTLPPLGLYEIPNTPELDEHLKKKGK